MPIRGMSTLLGGTRSPPPELLRPPGPLAVSNPFRRVEWLAGWLHQPIDAPVVQVITGAVGIVMTVLKAYALVFTAILLRWTVPRVRIDQLLDFGWKFLLPIALVNLLVTAALKLAFPAVFGG